MAERELILPEGSKRTYENFKFAPAIRAAGKTYCSGAIGVGPDGKVSDDPETQFSMAFESVKSVLAEAGLTFDDVVDITTFHVGLNKHMRTFMKVKDQYVNAPYPAWTAIGITELAYPGGLVEIKVVAVG